MLIDNVECTEHGVPLDGFKMGDVVDWMGVAGEIREVFNDGSQYPIMFYSVGATDYFTKDGMVRACHTRPSLRLVSRPRPKLEGWFNRYPEFGTISGIYKTVDEAKKGCDGVYCTGQVYMRECDPPKEDESNG